MKLVLICYVLVFAAGIMVSCTNGNNSSNPELTGTVQPGIAGNDSLSKGSDTAINYLLMKKYLPLSLPGFKTEGYPDTADRFTGEPTGETGSPYTSGGRLSFIKHLYKQKNTEVAIEIIDYKTAPDTYHGLYRMYDIDNLQRTDRLLSEFIDTGIPAIKAKQVYDMEENTATVHAFICNRFIINVQVVNMKNKNQAKDALKKLNLEELIKDYCLE